MSPVSAGLRSSGGRGVPGVRRGGPWSCGVPGTGVAWGRSTERPRLWGRGCPGAALPALGRPGAGKGLGPRRGRCPGSVSLSLRRAAVQHGGGHGWQRDLHPARIHLLLAGWVRGEDERGERGEHGAAHGARPRSRLLGTEAAQPLPIGLRRDLARACRYPVPHANPCVCCPAAARCVCGERQ